MANPVLNLHTWGFFVDDSSDPDTCTDIADPSSSVDQIDQEWALDTNLMVRLGLDETANKSDSGNIFLECQVNSVTGSWTQIDDSASSYARLVAGTPASAAVCDTQLLTSGASGTFYDSGPYIEAGESQGSVAPAKDEYLEFQSCIQLRSADLSPGDVVYFRQNTLGSTLDMAWPSTSNPDLWPQITVPTPTPNFEQHTWGFFEDDNSDVDACTQIGSDNSITEEWPLDTNLMVRIGLDEINGGGGSGFGLQFYYQINSVTGAWNLIHDSSSYVRTAAGTPSNTSQCDTQLLDSGASGSWNATGPYMEAGDYQDPIAFSADDFLETQICVTLRSADLSASDVVYFRVGSYTGGSLTYPSTGSPSLWPQITVASGTQATITGDVTVTPTVAATMDYTFTRVLNGSVTVPSTIAASMVANFNEAISGDISIPITIAASFAQYAEHFITGSVTVPITIASGMVSGDENIINGSISVSITPVATMLSQHPIVLYDSIYIAPGGENTTHQLDPPSGMTTGDFSIGRIQDDENPADSISANETGYTELEWSLQALQTAFNETWKFRVTIDSVAVTSDVIPKLAVSAAATIVGQVTVPITVAATMYAPQQYTIAGSITVLSTIAATLQASYVESITGNITVPITIAATLAVNYHESITGDVTVPITVVSTFVHNIHPSLSGDVTVPITVSSGMQSSYGFAITGAITVLITVAATLAANFNESIAGSVTVPITIASTLAASYHESITGAITIPVTVAASMDMELHPSIAGSVTVIITIASLMQMGTDLTGQVTVPITVAGTTEVVYQEALEGFRWRNDNGDETGATWAQNQDVNHTITSSGTARLRGIIKGVWGGQIQLECALDGTEDWFKVT